MGEPKPTETLNKLAKRWKREKASGRKFWRITKLKSNERQAVEEMVKLTIRQSSYNCSPPIGFKWSFPLDTVTYVAERYKMSDRKLRNLTKVALGYRRSHTEDTIDRPKDVYRFYGFEEARAKRLVFPSLRKLFKL